MAAALAVLGEGSNNGTSAAVGGSADGDDVTVQISTPRKKSKPALIPSRCGTTPKNPRKTRKKENSRSLIRERDRERENQGTEESERGSRRGLARVLGNAINIFFIHHYFKIGIQDHI